MEPATLPSQVSTAPSGDGVQASSEALGQGYSDALVHAIAELTQQLQVMRTAFASVGGCVLPGNAVHASLPTAFVEIPTFRGFPDDVILWLRNINALGDRHAWPDHTRWLVAAQRLRGAAKARENYEGIKQLSWSVWSTALVAAFGPFPHACGESDQHSSAHGAPESYRFDPAAGVPSNASTGRAAGCPTLGAGSPAGVVGSTEDGETALRALCLGPAPPGNAVHASLGENIMPGTSSTPQPPSYAVDASFVAEPAATTTTTAALSVDTGPGTSGSWTNSLAEMRHRDFQQPAGIARQTTALAVTHQQAASELTLSRRAIQPITTVGGSEVRVHERRPCTPLNIAGPSSCDDGELPVRNHDLSMDCAGDKVLDPSEPHLGISQQPLAERATIRYALSEVSLK